MGEAIARLRAVFPELAARSAAMRAILDRHASATMRIRDSACEASAGRALPELGALEAIEGELSGCLDAQDAALADASRAADALDAAAPPIEASQAQRFQSQKLEAIGQLTGGIAHDFNNLLTVVTSGLQLLSRTDDPERRRRLTRGMEEAAWRGADLTRRLLAFARRQPLNPQRLDVAPHLEGLRHLLAHGLRDDIRILTNVQQGAWPVEADLAALELAVLNLGVNARDAMPNGGTMVLGARNAGAGGLPAALDLAPGDYVELFVTDTGAGMTPEVLARVFEPFFTTKPSGQGTGLGLAQVYGFARQSGGTAWIESRPAHGTTVSMLLPRSVRAPADSAKESPPKPRVSASGHLAVLVVEDDDEVASVVLEMLDQLGHRGVRVSSLPAAIAVLAGSDCIDLIFSDVLLGGSGSGLDLAREVSRRNLQTPVVLTSGYGGGVTARLAAARLPFLRKPYTIDALRAVLQKAQAIEPAALG